MIKAMPIVASTLMLAAACTSQPPASTPPPSRAPSPAVALTPCPTRTPGPSPTPLPTPPPTAAPVAGAAVMTIETNLGTIVIDIDRSKTPCTAMFLDHLARMGFYKGNVCHRLTTEGIFVLQCGDPRGDGMSGPDFAHDGEALPPMATPSPDPSCGPDPQSFLRGCDPLRELPRRPQMLYGKGTVAMTHAGEGTTGSQFFFVYRDIMLPGSYTPLGRVRTGMEIIDRVAAGGTEDASGDGMPRTRLVIEKVTIG